MKNMKLWLSAGICLCCLAMKSRATETNPDSVAQISKAGHAESYNFFASDVPLHVTLRFDIGKLLKTKNQPEYLPAECKILTDNSDSVTAEVKIKARGFMRLNYCQFPPVFLKFCDKQASLNGQKLKGTFKIVTPCMRSATFEDYVLKEYLVYRLYNSVTPYSLLTRLILIRMEDTGRPGKVYEAYGFMIEDLDNMAARNNAVVIKNKNLCQRNMEPEQMNRVAIFNYIIGNTDWSVATLHNIKVIKPLNILTDKGIPVPYDFDYSAVVGAQYAAPAAELPIKDISERYYLGICENSGEFQGIIDEFTELKSGMLGTIKDFQYLPEKNKKSAFSYIENFYRSYKNEEALIRTLNRTCKQY
jgi:hypothetical protein